MFQKQAKRSRGKGADFGGANRFRHMLGVRLRFIHRPGNAVCFGFTNSAAQPLQFRASQKALAAALLELIDAARRIGALWNDGRAAREGVHAADHRQHTVGLKRRVAQ